MLQGHTPSILSVSWQLSSYNFLYILINTSFVLVWLVMKIMKTIIQFSQYLYQDDIHVIGETMSKYTVHTDLGSSGGVFWYHEWIRTTPKLFKNKYFYLKPPIFCLYLFQQRFLFLCRHWCGWRMGGVRLRRGGVLFDAVSSFISLSSSVTWINMKEIKNWN